MNSRYKCPHCQQEDCVVLVDNCGLCSRCQFAWALVDEEKSGWWCPKHSTELLASTSLQNGGYKIELFCSTCQLSYRPDLISFQLEKAFVLEEDL